MYHEFGLWLTIPRPAQLKGFTSYLDAGFPKHIQYLILLVWFGLNIAFGIVNGNKLDKNF